MSNVGTLEIKVSQANIDKGIPRHTVCCPIAHAVREAGYTGVRVGIGTIRTGVGTKQQNLRFTPVIRHKDRMKDFIVGFDKGDTAKPIELKLIEENEIL